MKKSYTYRRADIAASLPGSIRTRMSTIPESIRILLEWSRSTYMISSCFKRSLHTTCSTSNRQSIHQLCLPRTQTSFVVEWWKWMEGSFASDFEEGLLQDKRKAF